VEVSEPTTLSPDRGLFEIGIELSPSCNLKLDDRKLIEHGNQIAQQLQYFIASSKTFDMESLCIIPGKFCWNVCVDLLVLQMDGDPLDACSIATYIALNCTKIPKIEVYVGESGNPEDFEVTGDLGEAILLNARDIPICVSSCKVIYYEFVIRDGVQMMFT
jgi:exosome complex RNA-binding protein Rrp42 (RNase PH superfamily)